MPYERCMDCHQTKNLKYGSPICEHCQTVRDIEWRKNPD